MKSSVMHWRKEEYQEYRVENVLYDMVRSILDLAFAISILSRFMANIDQVNQVNGYLVC